MSGGSLSGEIGQPPLRLISCSTPRIDSNEPDSFVSQLRAEWDLQAMYEFVEERLNQAIALV